MSTSIVKGKSSVDLLVEQVAFRDETQQVTPSLVPNIEINNNKKHITAIIDNYRMNELKGESSQHPNFSNTIPPLQQELPFNVGMFSHIFPLCLL